MCDVTGYVSDVGVDVPSDHSTFDSARPSSTDAVPCSS